MTNSIIPKAWISDLRPFEAWGEKPYICPDCHHATHHESAALNSGGWWYCKYCYSNQRGSNSKEVSNFVLAEAKA